MRTTVKYAIISDIHGNKEALTAVLQDIHAQGIEQIVSLGDMAGYGPNPCEILEIGKDVFTISLQGNHERGVLNKIRNPDFEIRPEMNYKGQGAIEGITWAVHQVFGDDTPLPRRPVEPGKDAAKEEREEYKRAFAGWITRVNAAAGEIGRMLKDPKYEQNLLEQTIAAYQDDDNPTRSLLEGSQKFAKRVFRHLIQDDDARRIFVEYDEKIRRYRTGNKGRAEQLQEYLESLKPVHEQDGILLVHDNPFCPGDERYLLPPDKFALFRSEKSDAYERAWEEWDKRWPDKWLILFGHSHYARKTAHPNHPERVLCNPGSVGIPREIIDGALKASYAIIDTDARGLDAVQLVYVPLAQDDILLTGAKMEQCGLPNKFTKLLENVDQPLD